MGEIFVPVLRELLLAVATVLGAYLVKWIHTKFGTEMMMKIEAELVAKEHIVEIAVLFVQQVYEEVEGQQKLSEAFHIASKMMQNQGFTIEAEELKWMIQSAVKKLKAEFGDTWKSKTGS